MIATQIRQALRAWRYVLARADQLRQHIARRITTISTSISAKLFQTSVKAFWVAEHLDNMVALDEDRPRNASHVTRARILKPAHQPHSKSKAIRDS
jgi:hypothetical protein